MKDFPAPRLVVIGSSNTDLVLQCPRLPEPGETLLGGKFVRHAGGKGANQAVAAARAGARVSFVGRRDDDDFGDAALAALRREKIDVRSFRVSPDVSSGVALILLGGRARENLIAVAASANDRLSREDVEAASAMISTADVVLCQLEVPLPTIDAAAEVARIHDVPFILNPAPARKLPQRLLRRVFALTPNETEARTLTGLDDPKLAARELLRRGCRHVVVTLGRRGVWVASPGQERLIRAPRVTPVDTVGAGDCFSAWLAVGIGAGLRIEDAAERAVKAASVAVTRAGAQAGMPHREEVRV